MSIQEDILNILHTLEQAILDLPNRLRLAPNQVVIVGGLSDLSENLGLLQAGEFRSGNGKAPGSGFSGMRMAWPPMIYSLDGVAEPWNLVGVENDVLQFGIRASDGKALAGGGAVTIDENGIAMRVTTFIADNNAIHWIDPNDDLLLRIGAYYNSNTDFATLSHESPTRGEAYLTLSAYSATKSSTNVVARDNSRTANLWLIVDEAATAKSKAQLDAQEVVLYVNGRYAQVANGGLVIGSNIPSSFPEIGNIWFQERTSAPTPVSGYGSLYVKDDGKLYFKNDAGTETPLT